VSRAVIFGCSGPELTPEERTFFAEVDPVGFILFERNCTSPDQVRALCEALCDSVGRPHAPILIDQEGGRVRRLKPPHWREAPPARVFAERALIDTNAARNAVALNAGLIASELADLGIDVDCAPVLDLPQPDADPIIGDRAFGTDPEIVALLGRAMCDGLLAGGALPVIKHIPGHGRARADSHKELPRVDTPLAELRAYDFKPFKALADQPIGMTAHVVYEAIDPDRPATTSPLAIDLIRSEIGFDGVLVSDDLSMKALSGDFKERAEAALAAGCDVVLHCNGDMAEMRAVANGTRMLDAAGTVRLQKAADLLKARLSTLDRERAAKALALFLGS
jgi:beta-N-acetylhexosaminidase